MLVALGIMMETVWITPKLEVSTKRDAQVLAAVDPPNIPPLEQS
jgi:hypothetical protein